MNEQHQGRLLSLDVFRGITIAGMVLVNNPGDWSFVYPPLEHAKWHGWTPTDLIFPFFLFIVGVSMVFSIEKSLKSGVQRREIMRRVVRRSAILFLIGVGLHLVPSDVGGGYNWFRDSLLTVRIMGVLQRIALVYLFSSLIVLNSNTRTQIGWVVSLLTVYWAAMRFIPITLDQGGVSIVYRGSLEPEQNLAAYIDNLFLHGHTYIKGAVLDNDPEGILSTLPAIATGLLGVQAGVILKRGISEFEKTSLLFFVGSCGVILGLIMDSMFPINKALWSPSYVVLTAGLAMAGLAMCYYMVDIRKVSRWARPFIVLGTNPILVYICSELMAQLTVLIKIDNDGTNLKGWVVDRLFRPAFGDFNGSLVFAFASVLLMLAIVYPLYKKRILIRV